MENIFQRRSLVIEVGVITASLVAIASLLYSLQGFPLMARYHGLAFAVLFLYVPLIVTKKRGRKIDFLDLNAAAYLKSFKVYVVTSLIVFPLFLAAAHGWEKILYKADGPHFGAIPGFWKLMAFQLVMIALPEEFFFRGYVQSTLNLVFPRKWRLLGVNLGWAWIITAAVFAIAHSIVVLRWWHFAVFFPALLFGYLRERTGSITAPILFHATANTVMNWIGFLYR